MKIFPNPANEHIQIDIPSSKSIQLVKLFDLEGKLLKSFEFQGSKQKINITDLPDGIYIISAHSKSGSDARKLIVR